MSIEVCEDDGDQSYTANRDSNNCSTSSETVLNVNDSSNNDLMSRLSSFLPQIHAANIDLANTQNQSMLQIDQNVLLNDNWEEEVDEDDTDDDNDEDDDCVIEENDDDIVHISSPSKRIKYEKSSRPATIVMDIHMNQDINHPLFQALADKSSETDVDDDDGNDTELVHDGNAESDFQLPNFFLPHKILKPTTVSKVGCSNKLIEEVENR